MNIAAIRIAAALAAIRTRLAAPARDQDSEPHPLTAALLGREARPFLEPHPREVGGVLGIDGVVHAAGAGLECWRPGVI